LFGQQRGRAKIAATSLRIAISEKNNCRLFSLINLILICFGQLLYPYLCALADVLKTQKTVGCLLQLPCWGYDHNTVCNISDVITVTPLGPLLSNDSEIIQGQIKAKNTELRRHIDMIDLCIWRTLLTNKHDNKHYVQQQKHSSRECPIFED